MNFKKYSLVVSFFAAGILLLMAPAFQFNPLKISAQFEADFSQPEAQRKIASVNSGKTMRVRPSFPTFTPSPTPTPRDSSGAGRVSSAEARDLPILNLFNFFNANTINQPSIPTALCNDGSKPVYYIKKGFGAGQNRWIIWLEGGGGCGSADPSSPLWCGKRKNSAMSSSNGMLGAVSDMQGILGKSDFYNPDFYSYNQVWVHYCSSDFWGGLGEQRVINSTTGEKWWFSGRKIIEALMLDLKQKHSLSNASHVIVTGSSAGGSGITTNANEMAASIPQADVVTLVDAIHLFPYPSYFSAFTPEDERNELDQILDLKTSYSFLNIEGNRQCLRNKPANCGPNVKCDPNFYECMLPGYAAPYINTPVFFSSDQLDNMALGIMGFSFCNDSDPQSYSLWLNAYTQASQQKINQGASGYFLPRTGDHGLAPTHHWATPRTFNGSPIRLRDVFGAWYFNRNSFPKKFIEPAPVDKQPHQEVSLGQCGQRIKNRSK